MSKTKIAPIGDNRNQVISVWDTEGKEHKHTRTNAHELVRHLRYTLDAKEGEKRRAKPVAPVVLINDGKPKPQVETPTPVVEPVWEDLTTIPKDVLRKAAQFLKIADIDGRSSEKRIAVALDTALDQRLTASGDFAGSEPVAQNASEEAKAAALIDAISRRRRAYSLAAVSVGVSFTDSTTISQVVTSIAALVAEPVAAPTE